MKVKHLIEELENFDEDDEVYFSYDYGDHLHTQVAQKVTDIGYYDIIYSPYHGMYRLAKESDVDDEDLESVVVIF
ncbi:MAG: hypothetical protein K6T87_16175 [Roseiflexus sp.]|uniref:hypothetical protein n=1 Tax=Roseiflexus sp. TaxID=2562120 RepID=UPI0025E0B2E8|nr:hypothetical protein [Roseiflexus sp.]MCL6542094.1 hypothetical protein [Roseiflexus sp.]